MGRLRAGALADSFEQAYRHGYNPHHDRTAVAQPNDQTHVPQRLSAVAAVRDSVCYAGEVCSMSPEHGVCGEGAARREPLAIVGMACRFPKAPDLESYWSLLCQGGDAICEVPATRWDVEAFYSPDRNAPGKSACRWGGFLDDVYGFDWRAFKMSRREARYMDPQHRLMLEVAWEALEDAGIPLECVAGTRTAVFMGIMWNDYFRVQARKIGCLDAYSLTGNHLAFAANRLSYTFDLRGPSVSVEVGCASSLIALHDACMSVWRGESEMALAGGVNLLLAPDNYVATSKAGVLAADGRCKTLDADADGFVPAEGAGVVVVRPLAQALEAGDRVYALICGTATNHNGKNIWIMATEETSQVTLLQAACADANVDPSTVDYVEMHGTGTRLGDPIEASAIGRVFGGLKRLHRCKIGSVKSNLGHLESAASIAQIVKVALALHRGAIPPSINIKQLNPRIDLDAMGLEVQRDLGSWPTRDGPCRAGITALSLGGGNAHAILQEAPKRKPGGPHSSRPLRNGECHILPLSARSEQSLRSYAISLRRAIDGDRMSLEDICYTAAVRRSHHQHRAIVVFSSRQELIAALERVGAGDENPAGDHKLGGRPELAAQHEAMVAAYLAGESPQWEDVTPAGNVVTLPPYAWSRESLRIACTSADWQNDEAGSSETNAAPWHPLLGARVGLAAAPEHHVWQRELSADQLTFVNGHRISGNCVLPATAYVEMFLSAGRQVLGPGVLALSDMDVMRPIVFLEDGQRVIVQLSGQLTKGVLSLTVFSKSAGQGDEAWMNNARASVHLGNA